MCLYLRQDRTEQQMEASLSARKALRFRLLIGDQVEAKDRNGVDKMRGGPNTGRAKMEKGLPQNRCHCLGHRTWRDRLQRPLQCRKPPRVYLLQVVWLYIMMKQFISREDFMLLRPINWTRSGIRWIGFRRIVSSRVAENKLKPKIILDSRPSIRCT